MANSRSKIVTVSSIVGTKAYQIGVKDGYRNRPLCHPEFTTHSTIKNECCYEMGRFVGVYLRGQYEPIPKNRKGSSINPAAIHAFIDAQRAGYVS